MPRGAACSAQRTLRWLLKEGLPSAAFGPLLRVGALLRPLLPRSLQRKLPRGGRGTAAPGGVAGACPRAQGLLLAGCVQPGLQPNINPATARVLDAAGVQTLVAPTAGCCGALRTHLADQAGGLADMRRNIDAWLPQCRRQRWPTAASRR